MGRIDNDYFEKILVKNAMLDASYLAAIADYVKPEYFNNQSISKFFEIVNDFYERRQKLPTITEVKTYLTTKELKNGFRILVEGFKEIDSNLNKDELYENTERFLKERGMYHAILESAEKIGEDDTDPAEIVTKFEGIAGINLNTDHGIEIFSDAEKIIEDLLTDESTISSGWPWLDEALGGGFREKGKAMYVFAGQSNIGKSIFLGNIATNIAKQNKTVLLVSLEMSELLYAQRICSNITKIPIKDLKHDVHNLRDALKDEKRQNPGGRILIKEFPPSTITPKQLQAFIKKIIDSGIHIDAIVLDYLTLLHSPMGNNSYERGKYTSEQSRAMTYIFECPLITAAQLNRSAYNEDNPGMESMGESIGINTTADFIGSIFQTEEDQELGIIRMGVPKNRFGMRGMVQPMRIQYDTLTVVQSDDEMEMIEDEDEISLLEKLAN